MKRSTSASRRRAAPPGEALARVPRRCAGGDMIAIDPAIRSIGAAWYRNGVLQQASRILVPKLPGDPSNGARCLHAAHAVVTWVIGTGAVPTTLVYEWPQVYGKSRVDPNDLVLLGSVAGGIALAIASRGMALEVLTPTPREWTGGVPKTKTGDPWASARGLRIRNELMPSEFINVQTSHDAIDAVGLGLFALGRFERKRVFPGAT